MLTLSKNFKYSHLGAFPNGKIDYSLVVGNGKGMCGDTASFNFDKQSGTLTIIGTGEIWDSSRLPFSAYRPLLKKVVITDGITAIGTTAFKECENLEDVSIPDTVTHLYYGALWSPKLTNLKLPKNLKVAEYQSHH